MQPISELQFLKLKEKANKFFYVSFKDLEYESIDGYVLLKDNDYLIAFYGFNKELDKNELHWASNYASLVIDEAQGLKEEILVPLVPTIWETEFKLAGFTNSKVKQTYFKNINKTDYQI